MSKATTLGNRAGPHLIQVAFVIAFLAVWDISVRLGWVNALFLSGPGPTFRALGEILLQALPDLAATLSSFAIAFIVGVALALAVGMVLNLSRFAHDTFVPLLVLGVTIPKVTMLPLFVLWFGTGKLTVIIYGAVSAFFPMVVNVAAAGLEVKPNQLLLAKSVGYGHFRTFGKVVLPAMLPVLAYGLAYACNAAMMGVFIVELAQSQAGMGALIHDLAITFQTSKLYAAVLLTIVVTVLINVSLWYVARRLSRWRSSGHQ